MIFVAGVVVVTRGCNRIMLWHLSVLGQSELREHMHMHLYHTEPLRN